MFIIKFVKADARDVVCIKLNAEHTFHLHNIKRANALNKLLENWKRHSTTALYWNRSDQPKHADAIEWKRSEGSMSMSAVCVCVCVSKHRALPFAHATD